MMFIAKVKSVALITAACVVMTGAGVVVAKQVTGSATRAVPSPVADNSQPPTTVSPAAAPVATLPVGSAPLVSTPTSVVAPFPYTIATPAVGHNPADPGNVESVVISIASVATVPGMVGSRWIDCQQQVLADRIEVTPVKVGEPFAGKPKWPEKVAEHRLNVYVRPVNLAAGESCQIVLHFAGTREVLALSYDDATGLVVTPVQTRFCDTTAESGRSRGRPFRQFRVTDGDTEYCVSDISLAARRAGQWIWQVPISKWFGVKHGYPPDAIELDGQEIVVRIHAPKEGLTEPVVVRFSKTNGAFVSLFTGTKKWAGPSQPGDPDLKRQLERAGEKR